MERNELLLATRKGLFILECDNGTWKIKELHHNGIPISYAFKDSRTGILWAAQDHGHWSQKLVRSTDDGKSWEKIPEPQYPDAAQLNNDKKASLDYLWTLNPGGNDEPETLYIGTEPGGLFVSKNSGDSFKLVKGLWEHPSRHLWQGGGRDKPGIHSILVDPRDSQHIFVGISVAGVFESKDGGRHWLPTNRGLIADYLPDQNAEVGHDPHCLTWSTTNPDVIWQQNHCGIFLSHDGAHSWNKVSEQDGPAHFGFPIVVDENDPAVAWVVPAVSDQMRHAYQGSLCVSRTEDYGKSWTKLSNGLPSNAWDVVYRHAFDITGKTLAFGSTTGNVYLSTNRGEHWQCLGSNFPPIYCLRFA